MMLTSFGTAVAKTSLGWGALCRMLRREDVDFPRFAPLAQKLTTKKQMRGKMTHVSDSRQQHKAQEKVEEGSGCVSRIS